jgi:hypothetical protein
MTESESSYSTFIHLSAGLRTTIDDGTVKFWPCGKNLGVEVASFPQKQFGEIITNAGLRCIGNEERAWKNGYEDRFWNPALVPGLGESIADLPGHDWSALGNVHRERNEEEQYRLSSAAGFHLIGASRRLMHISEWYHQMLLYAHLNEFHDKIAFRNSDHTNFLIDCHSFLTEVCTARDHIAGYAGTVIAGVTKINTFEKLVAKLPDLSGELKAIMEEASKETADKMTLKHVGQYRNEIVHQRPISALSKGFFETVSFDLGLDNPILGVKFDIQVRPKKQPDAKFDALRSFHAMMRVLYEFGRAVIVLAPVVPKPPTFIAGKGGVTIKRIPARCVPFP